MNKVTKLISCFSLVFMMGFSATLFAQDSVRVAFTVNTSTMPDTLQPNHVLQIRGGVVGDNAAGTALPNLITWDSGSLVTENAGGDYWNLDFYMSPGDTLNYKFWAGTDTETPLINGSEQGWESGDNNQFILPADAAGDTLVPLQWYETREAPFTSEADSITVYFRVNVGAQVQNDSFDPETDKVGIRGADTFFANGWDATAFILEQDAVNGDNYFYSGSAKIHKDSAAVVSDPVPYKFTLLPDGMDSDITWEDGDNSTYTMPEADSTIHWKFFSNTPPSDAKIVDTNLNFEVNVGILEGLGYFNSSIDTVAVTGTFNGWNNLANKMTFNSFSGNYEGASIPLTAAVEADVAYKYYIRWDDSRDDPDSENYFPLISASVDGWEEPGITGGGNRILVVEDAENQPTASDFFNGVAPEALMTESNVEGGALTVTFSIDMSPATSGDLARPFNPASDSVFLSVEVPFFALTNGLPTYSDDISTRTEEERNRIMFTDEDEDMVYELEFELTLPTLNHFGFNIVYGEPTAADGEIIGTGPGGTEPGRRFYQYVTPRVNSDLEVSWPSTFAFPTLTWTKDPLPFEMPPDYTAVSNETPGSTPDAFSLSQNYPNPFNPTTNIDFNLANNAEVTLTVYNLLGQKVKTLVNNKRMNAGAHTVAFDASSLSSGVYFYRLQAGNFVQQRSMTLIK